jgi:hypothetical protein
MPLQNRVTPFGDITAIPQRGMLMGNRGIIHDPATRTLLRKRWSSKAWIICTCSYKDHWREVMAAHSWTELFFLDEAVALAAGHRPCFACRRIAAEVFRAAWSAAKKMPNVRAGDIDQILHRERLQDGKKRIHALKMRVDELPDGAVVASNGDAYTIVRGHGLRWTTDAYGAPQKLQNVDGLLTPPSTLAAMIAGYAPILHPSAGTAR